MKELVERIKRLEEERGLPKTRLKLVYLKKRREQSGLLAKELAQLAGIATSTLREWEFVRSGPAGIAKVDKIASFMGMDVWDITSREALEEYASQHMPKEEVAPEDEVIDEVGRLEVLEAAMEVNLKNIRDNLVDHNDVLEETRYFEERTALEERVSALEDQMAVVMERTNTEKESPGLFRKLFSSKETANVVHTRVG